MTRKASAIDRLIAAAQKGDAEAQYDLAARHRTGDGVPADLAESLRRYRKAAEAGHPDAMNDLGTMLLDGHGCKADPDEAFKWYEAAAQAGHPVACYNLAKRYLHDKRDFPEALHWFSVAAKHGDNEVLCEMGTMFRFGQGTERNLEAAAFYHVLAAEEGNVVAMGNIASYLEELQALALTGNPTVSICLSRIYNRGLGAEKSMPVAWAWTKWAKESCTPPKDEDEAADIGSAYEFYKQCLDPDDRKKGERILADLVAASRLGSAKAPAKRRTPRKT